MNVVDMNIRIAELALVNTDGHEVLPRQKPALRDGAIVTDWHRPFDISGCICNWRIAGVGIALRPGGILTATFNFRTPVRLEPGDQVTTTMGGPH